MHEPDTTRPRTRAPRQGRIEPSRIPLVDALHDVPGIPEGAGLAGARRIAAVRVLAVRRGDWDGAADAIHYDGGAGFLVVDGAVLRRVTARHRTAAELLGPGDVIRPEPGQPDVSWRVLADARLAVVDHRAMTEAGATPLLAVALIATATRRNTIVARQLAIAQWTSVDDRVVAVLRMLAERWGVVTPHGIALPAFLSHATLAPLLGARRPSVTTALQRLAAGGRVHRLDDGRWLVPGTH